MTTPTAPDGHNAASRVLPTVDWVESPLTMARKTLIIFLQQVFSAAPVGSCHWSQDDKESEIVISDTFPEDPSNLAKRPAVVVSVGPAQFASMTLDTEEYQRTSNDKVYSDLLTSSVAINCISPSQVEAERISWAVARNIWLLKSHLRRQGFHDIGRHIQVTPAVPYAEWQDGGLTFHVSTVAMPIYFQQRYRVRGSDTPREKFDLTIRSGSTSDEGDEVSLRFMLNLEDQQDAE